MIDIAVKVNDIDNLRSIPNELSKIGYFEIFGRLQGRQRVFLKGSDDCVTHHLHVIEKDEEAWDRKNKFRNILLKHEEIAKEYGKLKKLLEFKFPNDRMSYSKGKTSFILETLKRFK